MELVLTVGGQPVAATVRPASAELAGAAAGAGLPGQALEVQLPHRILLVRDAGGSTAQLVNAEVDGLPMFLQVLAAGPRQLTLQHCGAQRVVTVDTPQAAALVQHMPPVHLEDFSKVGGAGPCGCIGACGAAAAAAKPGVQAGPQHWLPACCAPAACRRSSSHPCPAPWSACTCSRGSRSTPGTRCVPMGLR